MRNQIIVVVVTTILWFIALCATAAMAQSACFERGYPSFDFTITGQFYCTNQLTAVPL